MNVRDRQSGQSLILVAILLGALSLTALTVFNAGMLSKEKTNLQNTADAAAYTSATFVARDLNFKAYTNRAMVANHIAIGQYVGLSSWLNMMTRATRNLATVTGWIPIVGQIVTAMQTAMNGVNQVMQPILRGLTTLTDFTINLISFGQQMFHVGMTGASIQSANDVISRNDPKINFGAVSNSMLLADTGRIWYAFMDRIPGNPRSRRDRERKNEFRQVVNDSKDPFSRRRTYTWLSTPRIPFIPAFRVRKAGGSDLVTSSRNDETMTAMDTVAIWQGNLRCRLFSGCRWRWREWLPAGWGATRAGENYNMFRGRGLRNVWGNTWRENRWTSSIAASSVRNGGNYGGLRSFYDLNNRGLVSSTPSMRIIVSKSENDIRTSSNTTSQVNGQLSHWSEGSMDIEQIEGDQSANLAQNAMSAISKSEAYFKRPNTLSAMRRLDRQVEFGNTYSPYWQPRLVDTSNSDRMMANMLINRVLW